MDLKKKASENFLFLCNDVMHASDQINITGKIAPITRRSSLKGRDNEEEDTRILFFLKGTMTHTAIVFGDNGHGLGSKEKDMNDQDTFLLHYHTLNNFNIF